MTKRIVSGVFLLIAFGALGLILAGALTSGEQLIVRFLTAVIVAALGLYVISDLRLQSAGGGMAVDDGAIATAAALRRRGADALPPDSTAAFMATVTGKNSKRSTSTAAALETDKRLHEAEIESDEDGGSSPEAATDAEAEQAQPEADQPEAAVFNTAETKTAETDAVETEAVDPETAETETVDPETADPEAAETETVDGPDNATDEESSDDDGSVAAAADDSDAGDETDDDASSPDRATERNLQSVPAIDPDEPYAQDLVEVEQWPVTPTGEPVEQVQTAAAALADDEVDGLVAIFAKEQDRSEAAEPALAANGDLPSFFASRPEKVASPLSSVSTVAPLSPAATDAISYTHAPIAPIIDLRLKQTKTSSEPVTSVSDIEAAIRSGEVDVISSLIDQGVLSTEGPLSDRDVRTMVYVAFTSSELRKILVAGGTVDGDNSDIDLGPIEVFRPAAALEE